MSPYRIAPAIALVLVVATSCAAGKQLGLQVSGPGSSGPSGSSGSSSFTMIDVTAGTPAEAEAALRAAGVTGSIYVEDNRACDVPEVAELHVCYTSPRAGQQSTTTIPVTLYLRYKETRSFYMPDLRGKTAEEAKQILIGMGQDPQRFIIEDEHGDSSCQPSRICRQSPGPGQQQWVSQAAWLWIGPAGGPSRPDGSRPATP